MNTNLISSPEISGNIGSCTTQVVSQASERLGWFKQSFIDIATNSCTGEVVKYDYWEFTATFGFFVGILAVFLLIGLLISLA